MVPSNELYSIGVILDVNREAFFVGIEAGAPRDGPAFHDAVEFEPQIVVQPPRGMLLNHVAVTVPGAPATTRLRRHTELSLFSVGFERHYGQLMRLAMVRPS